MKIINLLAVLLTLTLFVGCSRDDGPVAPTNNAPGAFDLLSIANNATGVDLLPEFSWEDATDPDGDAVTYTLYVGEDENPSTIVADDLTETSYTLEDSLSFDQTYHWKVTATDTPGSNTESSSTYQFETRAPTNNAPGAFDLLSVSNNATDVDVLPEFSWEEATDPDGDAVTYTLYVGKDLNTSGIVADIVVDGLTNTSYTLEDELSFNQTYYWKVTATDAPGSSTESSSTYQFITRSPINNATLATANAAFPGRKGHTTAVFDKKLWVIGGSSTGTLLNDVWYSKDGTTWTEATTITRKFPGRSGHTTAVFDNKLWVIGGYGTGTSLNDVWYSSDGTTWTEATTINRKFSERGGHTTAVFDNKLWVIGGGDASDHLNDIWYSSDGSNWTQIAPGANGRRFPGKIDHTTAVFDNKIWVIGGRDVSNNLYDDVWYSSDGSNWRKTPSATRFSERYGHTTAVFDNKLWVIGGYSFGSGFLNDVWYSSDGSNWTEIAGARGRFSGRHSHTTAVFKNKIWVIGGGSSLNDVWYLD